MKTTKLLTSLLVAGSIVASPAVMAKNHDHDGKHNKFLKKQYEQDRRYQDKYDKEKYDDKDRERNREDDERDEQKWRQVNDQNGNYQQLPPGLQKKVARGGALPPGWAKKLDSRYYQTAVQNGQTVYVIRPEVYRTAAIIDRPSAGIVRIRLDNKIVEAIENTHVIVNVVN